MAFKPELNQKFLISLNFIKHAKSNPEMFSKLKNQSVSGEVFGNHLKRLIRSNAKMQQLMRERAIRAGVRVVVACVRWAYSVAGLLFLARTPLTVGARSPVRLSGSP